MVVVAAGLVIVSFPLVPPSSLLSRPAEVPHACDDCSVLWFSQGEKDVITVTVSRVTESHGH